MGFKALALKHGWPNRHPPLGYNRKEDGKLEVNSDEAELIEYIFKRYCDLRSMPKVANDLNERDYETKSGGKWTARTVNKVLRNSIYCGRYSVADIEDEVPEYRIVEEDLFDQVTKIRHRFRDSDHFQTQSMEDDRKRKYTAETLDAYRDYLEERTSVNN
jgi:site-specific DNA recombinase